MAEIAYVDDDQDCLDIVKLSFKEAGIEVDIFDDPIDFYNKDHHYKILISDYEMPCLNGQDFLKIVKEKHPKLKTVIYSGVVETIDISQSMNVDTFLSKPIEFSTLLKTVRFLLHAYNKEASQAA